MKKTHPVVVTKASGDTVPFAPEKLHHSMKKVGASDEVADRVVAEIIPRLYPGITTKQIYTWAFGLLKKYARESAAKYHLRAAIMELGPTGFPFEQYIGELLKTQGYSIRIGVFMTGLCVTHEVDIVADSKEGTTFYECKFHNATGIFCGVQVPLYVHARFNDIVQKLDKSKGGPFYGGVVTNTKFSGDAITYGECAGLKLLSWDYPAGNSIRDLADKLALYPVTCLTTLSKSEKSMLLSAGIVACHQLHAKQPLLAKSGLREGSIRKAIDEVSHLCRLDGKGK